METVEKFSFSCHKLFIILLSNPFFSEFADTRSSCYYFRFNENMDVVQFHRTMIYLVALRLLGRSCHLAIPNGVKPWYIPVRAPFEIPSHSHILVNRDTAHHAVVTIMGSQASHGFP